MRSCVRPVGATYVAAGPPLGVALQRLSGSGWFPQTRSQPAYRTACVRDKARGVLVLGLTIFHHVIGLAVCVFRSGSDRSGPVGLVARQDRPDHASGLVRHGDSRHLARLSRQDVGKPWIIPLRVPGDPAHARHHADDQQPAKVLITHLRDASQPLLAAAGTVQRRQAEPGGKRTAIVELSDGQQDPWSGGAQGSPADQAS